MPDWNLKFKPEYDSAKSYLTEADYVEGWRPMVRDLKQLMTDTGFDASKADTLNRLRVKSKSNPDLPKGKDVSEDRALLSAVAAWKDTGGAVTDSQKMRLAVLKMLRHLYLLNKTGNKQVWLHSLPDAFTNWSTDEFNSASTFDLVKNLLKAGDERFSTDNKKHFAAAAQHGLAWCQKTNIVLANAAGTDKKRDDARSLVKRWFADPSVTDTMLDGYITTLSAGFKNIAAAINAGRIVITDYVPLRGATSAEDLGWLGNNAFTFASRGEGMDVVYVENGFFTKHAANVLKGQSHHTRILVHELTHLVAGTDDVDKGGKRYAWRGIGPHAGFTGDDAIKNADSWACFAGDCGGAFDKGALAKALKIV